MPSGYVFFLQVPTKLDVADEKKENMNMKGDAKDVVNEHAEERKHIVDSDGDGAIGNAGARGRGGRENVHFQTPSQSPVMHDNDRPSRTRSPALGLTGTPRTPEVNGNESNDFDSVDFREIFISRLPILQMRTNKSLIDLDDVYVMECQNIVGKSVYMIVFSVMAKITLVEEVVRWLREMSIGIDVGTLNIVPADLVYKSANMRKVVDTVRGVSADQKGTAMGVSQDDEGFWDSIKNRLVSERIIQETMDGAAFTFDYLMLLIMASMLASVGLATNNTVVIVASMLVSPLMGPILAFTFGTVIKDKRMISTGVRTEMIGLLVCVISGMVVGFCFAVFGDTLNWPNSEMSGRGTLSGVIVGVLIAVPSGIGVSLSVLGDNKASLVGVAISASLLPPAVNAGMNWAYALFAKWNVVSDKNAMQFFKMGFISLVLTLLNILCVYFTAVLMFKVKEVAPIPGKSSFWSNLKVMRENQYNRNVSQEDDEELYRYLKQVETERKNEAKTLSEMMSFRADLTVDRQKHDTNSPRELMDLFTPPPNSQSSCNTSGPDSPRRS